MKDTSTAVQLVVAVFAGLALVASVLTGQTDTTLAIGGGLVGYLGATVGKK